MRACIASGDLPPTTKPSVAIRVLMAGLLGLVSMRLSERLAAGEDADDLAEDVIEVALAGLHSGVTLRSAAVDFCSAGEPVDLAPAHSSQEQPHLAQALTPAGQESR